MNTQLLHRRSNRSGSILIVVLVVVVLLSLTAYAFTSLMQTEDEATRLATRQVQSKYLVHSGVEYARAFLSYDRPTIMEKGGLWDNDVSFRGVPVVVDRDNEENFGKFTIITSSMDVDDGTPDGRRYGLFDESAKLNLNVLPLIDEYPPGGGGRQLLLSLPFMDQLPNAEEIADAILDWLDEDDEPREFGAESDYYASLPTPYRCKNGPMDSVDELLLIRGITPQMLFGDDVNRNGIIDQSENVNESQLDAEMRLGWLNYLTLYSKESNLNDEKLVRININGEDLEQLYNDLGSVFNESWSVFIIMARVNGVLTEADLPDDAEPVSNAPFVDLDFDALESSSTFNQILDLAGTFTSMEGEDGSTIYLRSPIAASPILDPGAVLNVVNAMTNITTYEGDAIPGRMNVMQAPRRLLLGIPGLSEEVVDLIITRREFELDDPEVSDLSRKFETWLWTEGLVDLDTMRAILPFVCVGGDVFKAEVVGFFDDGIGSSRAEVILDATAGVPRILFWRNKSHLQTGWDIDTLGRTLIE